MLDKQSAKTLDYLISIADDDDNIANCDNICTPRYSKKQTFDSIHYLHDNEYVELSFYWDGDPSSISLTYKGLHYKDFDWIKLKSFLFESMFVPIVVAFVTSLIANLLFGK